MNSRGELLNFPILLFNSYQSTVEFFNFTVEFDRVTDELRSLTGEFRDSTVASWVWLRSGKDTETLTLGCQILTTNLLMCRE